MQDIRFIDYSNEKNPNPLWSKSWDSHINYRYDYPSPAKVVVKRPMAGLLAQGLGRNVDLPIRLVADSGLRICKADQIRK